MDNDVFERAAHHIAARVPAWQHKSEVGHQTVALPIPHKAMRGRASRAQAMVEFALALPIFLLVVYGLLEVGRLIFMEAAVASASREGARYASAWGINSSGTPQYQDCAGIKSAVRQVSFLLSFPNPNSQILIFHDTGPGTAQVQYCTGTSPATDILTACNRVVVTVKATYQPILPFFLPLTTKNMTSTTSRTLMGVVDLDNPSSCP